MDTYQRQAQGFCDKYGLTVTAVKRNTKPANWTPSGDHYRVTIKGENRRLSFDWWGSIHMKENNLDPTSYDILSTVSAEAYCPDSFEDFCAEFGYETDSRKTHQIFSQLSHFSGRIQRFFTSEELEELSQIQ